MTTHRLPKNVRPVSYAITLDATPKKKTFSGEVTIALNVLEAVSGLELNARGLAVKKVSCQAGGKKVAAKAKVRKADEVVEISAPLKKGKATLTLAYTGTL